ncbi:MAG: hypothetical protein ABEI98_10425 [Halorhabdus sp.]
MIEFASLPKRRTDTKHERRVVRRARDTRVCEMPSRVDNRQMSAHAGEDRLGWAEAAVIERPAYDRLEFTTPQSSFVRNFERAWIEGVPIRLDPDTEVWLTPIDGRELACRFVGEGGGRTDERELHVTSADPTEVYA